MSCSERCSLWASGLVGTAEASRAKGCGFVPRWCQRSATDPAACLCAIRCARMGTSVPRGDNTSQEQSPDSSPHCILHDALDSFMPHNAQPMLLNIHSASGSAVCHQLVRNKCLRMRTASKSSPWMKLVSDKSKVSNRDHCRSDPVRVQSTVLQTSLRTGLKKRKTIHSRLFGLALPAARPQTAQASFPKPVARWMM